jgi:hypothetical protein
VSHQQAAISSADGITGRDELSKLISIGYDWVIELG